MIFNLGSSPPGFPILTLTYDGTEYEFAGGDDVEVSGAFKLKQEDNVFKAWLYADCTLNFAFIPSSATSDLCIVGHGGRGAGGNGSYGGSGGYGGKVMNYSSQSIATGTTYTATIDATQVGSGSTSFIGGDISHSVGTGGGATGGGGGSGSGYPSPSSGFDGSYAFSDSTFDGIKYAPGGGGRAGVSSELASPGETAWSKGCGGNGGWIDGGAGGYGVKGCVLLRITT